MTIQISRHTIIGAPSMKITRPKSAAAFSPLDLSPVLWLDFSDVSTLFQDSAGNTPVASDGDAIGRAEDKSTNGNHATQGTTANKPLYKTGIQNGLSVGQTDTGDFMTTNAFTRAQPSEAVAVLQQISWSAGRRLWTSLTPDELMAYQNPTSSPNLRMFSGGVVTNTSATLGAFHLLDCLYDGANSKFWVDGGNLATGNVGAAEGDGFVLGSDTTLRAEMYVGEIVVLEPGMSNEDRASLETYLNDKWAVF